MSQGGIFPSTPTTSLLDTSIQKPMRHERMAVCLSKQTAACNDHIYVLFKTPYSLPSELIEGAASRFLSCQQERERVAH